MQILERFGRVWHPDFLTRLLADKKPQTGRTWAFWFLSSTLVAVLMTVAFAVLTRPLVAQLGNKVNAEWTKVPTFTADIKDGKLTTDLPQPFTVQLLGGKLLFAVDTAEKQYQKDAPAKLQMGAYFFGTSALLVDPDGKTNTIEYKAIVKPLHFTKASIETAVTKIVPVAKKLAVAGFFLIIWLTLAVGRLLPALLWAGLLWLAAHFLHLKPLTYGTAYLAVLNLAFVPLVLGFACALLSLPFLPSAIVISVLVLGGNLWWLKKHGHKTHA